MAPHPYYMQLPRPPSLLTAFDIVDKLARHSFQSSLQRPQPHFPLSPRPDTAAACRPTQHTHTFTLKLTSPSDTPGTQQAPSTRLSASRDHALSFQVSPPTRALNDMCVSPCLPPELRSSLPPSLPPPAAHLTSQTTPFLSTPHRHTQPPKAGRCLHPARPVPLQPRHPCHGSRELPRGDGYVMPLPSPSLPPSLPPLRHALPTHSP